MKKIYILFIYFIFPALLSAQNFGTFTQVGPVLFPNNPSVQTTGMGRVSQLVYHPTDSNTLFAVTASGGVFKSSNEGLTWRPISDYMPQTACASLAINPLNPKVMLLGTGDANYNGGGLGVWRTNDGGNTWFQSTNGIGNRLVSYILYTPNDTNILIAACFDGIYKSYDGGSSWAKKTAVGASYRSLTYRPKSNNILYAATDALFYRSYNNGETWIQSIVNSSINCAGIKIAVCASDTSKLFCVVWKSGASSPFGGVYKSTDNGNTFKLQVDTPNILGYSGNGSSMDGQGAYNLAIAVDPNNANIIYVTGINIWKSTDQGLTFTMKSHWAFGVHADKHGILFSPYNANKLFIYHDGGLDRSMDGGNTWTTLEDGLSASEFYKMGNSGLYNDYIIGGLQDNGMDVAVNKKFSTVRGGDWGGDFAFDAFDSSLLYENGGIKRNIVTNATGGINGQNGIYLVHPKDSNVLFEATTNLFRTKNIRANPSTNVSWSQLTSFSGTGSPRAMAYSKISSGTFYLAFNTQALYRSDNINATTPTFTTIATFPFNSGEQIKQLETCDYDSNTLYVVTSQARLLKTNNKGTTWVVLNKNLPSVNIIKFLLDQKTTDSSMYVCNAFGVYYRNRFIKNWQNYSKGLPTVAQISDMEIMSDGTAKSRLHVSTYGRGIWQVDLYKSTTQIPVADFVIQTNASQVCANTLLLIDNSIGSPTSSKWQILPAKGWSFINGTDSLSPRGEIKFNTAGVYFISLMVSNSKGSHIRTVNYNYSNLSLAPTCSTTTNILTGFGIGIFRFEFNTIDKSSGAGVSSNEDFSCNSNTIVKAGGKYTAWVTSGVYNNENAKIYIDYNNNGAFTDVNEMVGTISSGMGRRSCTINILVNPPVTGKFIRMRIVSDFSAVTAPCGVLTYGQSEDYALWIDQSKPTVSIIIPNPTVSNVFNATFKVSEVVTGFDASDITMGNAVLSGYIQTDPTTYMAKITPMDNGIVTLDISAGSFMDFAGNPNNAASNSNLFFLGVKTFTFAGISVSDSIKQTPSGGNILCKVPYGTKLDSLIAAYTLSDTSFAFIGTNPQTSGVTKNNFKTPVIYQIKSKNNLLTMTYTVNVSVNKNQACKLLTYGFLSPAVSGIITQTSTGGIVDLTVPYGTNLSNIVALFTLSDSATAKIGSTIQVSSVTSNNFTAKLIYKIVAQDTNFKKIYEVNVVMGKSKSCDLLTYAIQSPPGNGVIVNTGNTGGTVTIVLPFGTPVSSLKALFTVSDSAVAWIGAVKQQSGQTVNDFSQTLLYKIVAEDTAYTKSYMVSVQIAPNTEADLIEYSIVSPAATGVIVTNVSGGFVGVKVPYATDLTQLVAQFKTSDSAKVFVGSLEQKSGLTPNDYSDTVRIIVKAQDNIRTKTYLVTVAKLADLININNKQNIKIYPNPGKDLITISTEDIVLENLQIYTITGKEVYHTRSETGRVSINTSDWSNGVYMVRYKIKGYTGYSQLMINR